MHRNNLFSFLSQSNQQIIEQIDEEKLKSLIVAFQPALIEAFESGNFTDATDEIRQFSTLSLLWNPIGLSSLPHIDPLKHNLSASQFRFYFDSGELAVNAAGACAYLSSLYRLFGFYSGWYRVGVPHFLDHALCVVGIPGRKGELDLLVQDPILQSGFATRNSNSRNLADLLNVLETSGANNIRQISLSNVPLKQLTFDQNGIINSYLSETKASVDEIDCSIQSGRAQKYCEPFVQLLPEIVDRPDSECGIADYIRFALTTPVMGVPELDKQLELLFDQLRTRLQRPFSPTNVRFDLKNSIPVNFNPDDIPDVGPGWKKLYHGYSVPINAYPDEAGMANIRSMHESKSTNSGLSSDATDVEDLELFSLTFALQQFPGETVYMLELGSGYGNGCLIAASLVNFGRISPSASKLEVAAIEAEPNHYKWTLETFRKQGLGENVFFGAVADKDGTVRFKLADSSQNNYGQSIKPKGNFVVPSFTLNSLVKMTGFPRIHILHMDIQGAETGVLAQARDILGSGLIDFIVLGTHGKNIEEDLHGILAPTHELLLEVQSKTEIYITELNTRYAAPVDGFQFYRRWGLK